MSEEVSYLSIPEIQASFQTGESSITEFVEEAFARIERFNEGVNAVVSLREYAALQEAAEAEKAKPEEKGPLHGLPILIKDLNELLDLPTTYGSLPLANNVADFESLVVTRLKQAGAIVIGKSNTPEFGLRPTTENSVYGYTRNPFDHNHTAGGSSGGAAAALATGMVPIALGGDGGGSCRIPASCCGVVGFKPSRGRVPWAPIAYEYWAGIATNGPLARTVGDARTMLDVMTGPVVGEPYAPSAPERSIAVSDKSLRIGMCLTPPHGAVDSDVADTVKAAADTFRSMGHQVEECSFDLSGLYDDWMTVVEANTAMTVRGVIGDSGLSDLESNTLALALRGEQKTAADYAAAVFAMRNRSAEIMKASYDYDAILTPTLTTPPLELEETLDTETHEQRWQRYLDWLAFTYPINCTGQPALSLPGGISSANLPIGIQLVGRMGDDQGVLALGVAFEDARPWRDTFKLIQGGSI